MGQFEKLSLPPGHRAGQNPRARPIGEILVNAGLLNHQKLSSALALQTRNSAKLGEILIANGLISRDQLNAGLSAQSGLRWVDISAENPPTDAILSRPPEDYLKHSFIPIRATKSYMTVAIAHPNAAKTIRKMLSDQPLGIKFVLFY